MKILVIVPTRGRPENARDLIETFRSTVFERELTDLLFVIDDDDPEIEGYRRVLDGNQDENIRYEVCKRMRMNATLNRAAVKYSRDYDVIGFLGDDHRFRTDDWDLALVRSISGNLSAIRYGDDLLQGENLPTAVFITTDIIHALGYMAPPEMVHMYLDNFWKDLGEATGIIKYMPEIVIEHMHYINGKGIADDQYLALNSSDAMQFDAAEYERYKEKRFRHDVTKFNSHRWGNWVPR
jgi:hypothetical protein